MISFRYHVVSIVSVLLALAIGVALGGGPLQGEVDNTLVDQVRNDRQVKSDLAAQVTSLRSANAFTDAFAATVAPGLIGNILESRVVTLVVLPTAQQSDVAALRRMVKVAGGTVGGTMRVGDDFVDAGNKQLVEKLGDLLEDGATGLAIPPDASPYERIGTLIARAIGTEENTGAEVDGPATSILAGLRSSVLVSTEGRVNRRGSLVLFVTGPGQGSVQDRRSAATIVAALVQAVDEGTDGVVLAGPPSSARAYGQVKAVRDDVTAAREVSTVDSLGRTAGEVVTIMALAEQSSGRTGQYGAVDAADGAMPGSQGATD